MARLVIQMRSSCVRKRLPKDVANSIANPAISKVDEVTLYPAISKDSYLVNMRWPVWPVIIRTIQLVFLDLASL